MTHSQPVNPRLKSRGPKDHHSPTGSSSRLDQHVPDVPDKPGENEVYGKLMQKLVNHPLYAHVKSGMYRSMMHDVDDILLDIKEANLSPQASVNVAHHMLLLAYKAAHESGIIPGESIEELSFQDMDVSQLSDYHSLREHVLRRFQFFMEQCENSGKRRQHSLIMKMKQYIDLHYKDHITLTSLAHHFNISSSYLSYLFREQTSSKFIEYLSHVRIQKAKELLRTSDLRVYEIADSIGYRDAHYFSAAFKRIVGISPSEYRERMEQDVHSSS